MPVHFPYQSTLRRLGLSAVIAAAPFAMASLAASAAPSVVTSIKPVHSLVAGVMEGVGDPHLLIDGFASPHGFALKPSQAFLLQGADVVFWVGGILETSLKKPMTTIAAGTLRVDLVDAPGLRLLPLRDGDGFGKHDHDHDEPHAEHGDDDHKSHEHTDENNHDHADEAAHEENHGEDAIDAHIWLDPENARAMVREIAVRLSEADPGNADLYKTNAAEIDRKLAELTLRISKRLEPVKQARFIVFHDAYHYFEDRFGVQAEGTILLNPEVPASAEQVANTRERIHDAGVSCVFSEPQFDSKLVGVVLEGSSARMTVLDPLGSALTSGPGLYFELLDQTADAIADCLEGS